jgi:Protein of unknown function (DUF2591)
MKIKTNALTGRALNWAVCLALGNTPVLDPVRFGRVSYGAYDFELGHAIKNYLAEWEYGGPIIEREKIAVCYEPEWEVPNWGAWRTDIDDRQEIMGETPLIAAMRCFCCAKLGDEIEIPGELLQCQQPNL